MGKGLLSGVAWGALASALVLGGASVLTPMPGEGLPEEVALVAPAETGGLEAPSADMAPEAPEPAPAEVREATVDTEMSPPPGSDFARAGEDTQPAAPGADASPVAPAAPVLPGADVAVDSASAPAPDTAPPAVPETATEGVAAPVAPVAEDSVPRLPGTETGEVVSESSPAPDASAEPQPEVATSPDTPRSTPEVVEAEVAVEASGGSEAVSATGEREAVAATGADTVRAAEAGESTAPTQAESVDSAAPERVTVRAEGVVSEAATVSPGSEAVAPRAGEELVAAAERAPAARVESEGAVSAPAQTVTGEEAAGTANAPAAEVVVILDPAEAEEGASPATPAPAESVPAAVVEAEAPATTIETAPAAEAAQSDAETPDARREAALPANPSTPPASVPITEREPRVGLPGRAAGSIGGGTPGFGKRVVPLTERNKPASRLPSIGESAEAEAEATAEAAPQLSALAANAAPFENPENLPLFSVILLDVGDQGLDRAALKAINFPVTFAIDPTDPGAAATAKGYRDAGFEVLILPTGLPEGARPQDLETTLQSYFASFPGAAGLLDTGEDGIQGNPALTRQLLDIAADTGHGLVFVDHGLNSALRGAEKAGLSAGLVWRKIDAEGESGPAIGRALDRAAFRAGQEGEVMLIGHSYTGTVTSLLNWAAGQKGSSVAFAPVSAVLMR